MGCLVRALVALVVLAGLLAVIGAARSSAAPGGFDRNAIVHAVVAGTDTALSAVGEATARTLAWGWERAVAIPWSAVPRAATRLARGLMITVGTAAASLTRTESGEPLDAGRLTAYAAGWVLLALVVTWVVLRRLVRWIRGVWRCAAARRTAARRNRSPAGA